MTRAPGADVGSTTTEDTRPARLTAPVRAVRREPERSSLMSLLRPVIPDGPVTLPDWAVRALRVGAAGGAAVLAGTSTGSITVAAVLLATALADRRAALAVGLAVTAVAVRFATTTFDELAGLQSVLGPAVEIGPTTGAASAWLSAVAVLFAVGRVPGRSTRLGSERHVPAVAVGLLAAAIAAGAGPGGEIWLRVAASAGAVVIAWLLSADRVAALGSRRRSLAVLAGIAAVVCAGWPT